MTSLPALLAGLKEMAAKTTAWAVSRDGVILAKTVHDTRRGALVNWLITECGVRATVLADDVDIEQAWRSRRSSGTTVLKINTFDASVLPSIIQGVTELVGERDEARDAIAGIEIALDAEKHCHRIDNRSLLTRAETAESSLAKLRAEMDEAVRVIAGFLKDEPSVWSSARAFLSRIG